MRIDPEESGLGVTLHSQETAKDDGPNERREDSTHLMPNTAHEEASPEKANHDTIQQKSKDDVIELRALTKYPSNGGLTVPTEFRPNRARSPDTISLISADDFSELRQTRLSQDAGPVSPELVERPEPGEWRGLLASTWSRNKGILLVLVSQVFGTLMSLTTRMLEMGGKGERPLDPFQVSVCLCEIFVLQRDMQVFACCFVTNASTCSLWLDPLRPYEYYHKFLSTVHVVSAGIDTLVVCSKSVFR